MIKAGNNGNSSSEIIPTGDVEITVGESSPEPSWSEMSEAEHFVQFYESDLFLSNSLGGFIGEGLTRGDACIVAARKEIVDRLEEHLRERGLDVATARASGQYITLDAAETLSKFVFDGSPDPARFAEVVGGAITEAGKNRSRVRIFGEMVALLWSEGKQDAAIHLEELWNGLRENHPFSLFCAYPMRDFNGASHTEPFNHVCAKHSRVIPAESYSALKEPNERLREIALLQQKANMLEAEIAERKRVQETLLRRERELEDFMENATVGLHRVGADGTILWANRAEMNLLGYAREEYIGHNITEFHADQEIIDDILNRLTCHEELHDYEARLKAKDGSIKHVLINSNVYWESGEFKHTRCITRDITDRKRAEEIGLHLAAIVESSDDAIISKTLEGIILSWNKGAERIFGYTADEVVGKSILILIPPDRRDEEPAILERIRKGERIDHYETVRMTKDGRAVDISLTVSPVREKSGRIIAASKIARDITERRRAETEREQLLAHEQMARAEAEKANRLKDEFLATVSHELRTPLNAIIGWSYMLRSGTLDEATSVRALEAIERNAKSQAQLVEDILDMSRVITGKLRLSIEPVDVASVINAAIDSVQLAADSKSIQLEVTLDPSARHTSGDSGRLQQVVWNLLSNAIKFTPAGGRVRVQLERSGSNAQIKVSDTGQGISRAFLPFIFDRFRQADGSSTRRHGGLGLGLAIVRHLVELHGGTVEADSPGEGLGSTFTIRLPLAPMRERTKRERRQTGNLWLNEDADSEIKALPSLEGVRVLLVDDDEDTLNMLTIMLTENRATVESARSASEALEALEWYDADVLVSDIAMPDEDGYSLISKLRELEAKGRKAIPAVALTAFVRIDDRARALSAGFNMFVPKPVELTELILAISSLAEAGMVN